MIFLVRSAVVKQCLYFSGFSFESFVLFVFSKNCRFSSRSLKTRWVVNKLPQIIRAAHRKLHSVRFFLQKNKLATD